MYELKFDGITDVINHVINAQKLDDIKKIVRQNLSDMARFSARVVPVKTGFLKRSLTTQITDNGLTGIANYYADYSPYQEYGTRWISGKFYMKRGFDNVASKFIDEIERVMK